MTNVNDRRKAVSARLHAQIAALTAQRDEARTQRDGMAAWARQALTQASALLDAPAIPRTDVQLRFIAGSLDRALALLDCPAHDERTHVCQLRDSASHPGMPPGAAEAAGDSGNGTDGDHHRHLAGHSTRAHGHHPPHWHGPDGTTRWSTP